MVETIRLEVTLEGYGHGSNVTSEQHIKAGAERVRELLLEYMRPHSDDDITVVPCRDIQLRENFSDPVMQNRVREVIEKFSKEIADEIDRRIIEKILREIRKPSWR